VSIEFDTYTGGSLEGTLDLTLPAPSAVITPTAYTAMRAELPGVACAFIGEVSLLTPVYVGIDAALPHVILEMSGFVTADGTLDLTLPAPAVAFYDGARVDMLLPAPTAYLTDAYPGYALIDLHLDMLLAGEYGAATLTDELSLTEEYSSEWAVVLQEIIGVSDSLTLLARVAGTITDSVVAEDYVAAIFLAMLEDDVRFEPELLADLRLIVMVADQLMMEDEGISHLSALVTVAAAFLIGDAVVAGRDLTLEDEIHFVVTDELETKLKALVELLDELLIEDEATASLSLLALLEDIVQLEGVPLGTVSALAEVLDEVTFTVRITTPAGDTFVGYAMNIRNSAVTEYDNYPFNSFAIVGGRPYGASAEGVFRLEGDDDNGDPIAALVRTGILSFESLTKVPNGWIMLKSNGEMMMKTIVMDGGQKKENWYKMKARPEGEPVESRFDIAKGLTGTYWQWELANIDGAYFELDVVKVWPLRLQRRYSGR
jgi:hypothetical protein